MDEIQYIGEHLWLGTIGHFLLLLSFVAAGFSALAYYNSIHKENSWAKLGKSAYIIHGCSILGVIGLILYAMVNHFYEYDYVYRTVADNSQTQYLLAAFWADQEGSFLLWMFWHVILGWVFIAKGKSWTAPTMITLALIQAFLTSMLLGIYVPFLEDTKIGSNPFILVRDVYDAPIFSNADYLTLIEGRGLNPLLQNYWMTIHPPVLFLGFASVSIPYCMAIGGLSSNRHAELMRPILKWSLFSAAIYGLGILMGGAWAYEALTFGGYWAWDPVENTSLVPWLILVAGIHTNLVARATTFSMRTTYLYYCLAFNFIVYSTFLTRSGILGDTSVHAFTTMGLETQLALFIAFFLLLAFAKYIIGRKTIPSVEKEEAIYSREFWMFVGALVLFFSGILMTVSTSLPVYNKIVELWDPNHVPIAIDDPMHHHNKYQIWIGVFIGILSSMSIFLRYKGVNWSSYRTKFVKHAGISMGISALLTLLFAQWIQITGWQQYFFLFAGLLAIVSHTDYLVTFIKGRLKQTGSVFSHMGFGILILGIMISGLNKRTITSSQFEQGAFTEGNAAMKAIVLIKDEPLYASGYWLNYTGDTIVHNLRKYLIDFVKVDSSNQPIEQFTTKPSAVFNRDFSKIEAFNPGNRRTLTYDIFTAAAPPPYMQDIEQTKALEDSLKYLSHLVQPGEVFEERTYFAKVGAPIFNYDFDDAEHGDSMSYDLTVGIPMEITIKRTGEVINVVPGLGLKNAFVFQIPAGIDDLGIKIKVPEEAFAQIFTEEDQLAYEEVSIQQGGEMNWKGYNIQLTGFDRSGKFKNYVAQEGDIAIGADLLIVDPQGNPSQQKPVFILRNAQQFSIKDYNPNTGLHVRFSNIDPATETMTFRIAKDDRADLDFELLIAEDVPRSDILIVESNIFPGINLVWLGCLMMLGGLVVSLVEKRKVKG